MNVNSIWILSSPWILYLFIMQLNVTYMLAAVAGNNNAIMKLMSLFSFPRKGYWYVIPTTQTFQSACLLTFLLTVLMSLTNPKASVRSASCKLSKHSAWKRWMCCFEASHTLTSWNHCYTPWSIPYLLSWQEWCELFDSFPYGKDS